MAETPKGDTASPTEATDLIEAEQVQLADTAKPSVDGATDGTIAGDIGRDRLASTDARPDPVSPRAAKPAGADDRARPREARSGDDAPTAKQAPAPDARSGTLRRTLILVILLALVIGGGYATYPEWRGEVEPFARQFGISLPAVKTASAPEAATPAPPAKAPEPVAQKPVVAEKPAAPQQPMAKPSAVAAPVSAPTPPATVADPALAGDVDRLVDRVNALEQRLTAIANRPPEPAKADAEAVAQLQNRVDDMSQTLTAVTDEVAIVREGLGASGGGEGLGPMAAQLSERLQGLTDRMDSLQKTVQTAPAEPAVKPEEISDLRARLDTLAGGLAKLTESLATLTVGLDRETRKSADAVSTLEARLEARMETQLADLQGQVEQLAKTAENTRSGRERAGAFLLAANQLAAVAATSGGFGTELQALRAAAPVEGSTAAALETLDGHAGGVPSLAVLRDRFATTAAAAVDASVIGSGEGFVGQALKQVASLVTIRRTGAADGDGLDALLVRAETALAAGDLAAAITAVRKIDGDPGKAAAGWLADAEARAAVDVAVRTLQAAALAHVAGG